MLLVAGLTVVIVTGGLATSQAVLSDHVDVPHNTFATSDEVTT